jgi:CubicO group peptidase (beta-lactamase class C family)
MHLHLKKVAVAFVCLFALVGSLNAQWQARHNLTPAQFQSTFDDLTKQGYRLKTISGYVSGGQERFAGLWTKEGGPAWYARAGLSAADYQKAFDDYNKQGFRLTWVSAHEVGGVTHFQGIWEQKSGPAWQARANLSAADYQNTFNDLTKQGYRLLHVYGYASGGNALFAAIFDKSAGPAWETHHNMTAAQFQSTFNTLLQQGYRLKEMSGYNVGGQDLYTGIWEKTGGPIWYARNGVPDSWYQNVFDNFYYQGFQPAFITAFTSGSGAKLNSIWTNTNFSNADLSLITSKMNAYLNANQVPGLAVAITKDGRLVYAAGFGYANKETGEEAGPTSLFRIASVSKPITSAAIMKLIESGKLSLTDHVFGPGGKLASEFPTPANNTKINEITIKYLLEHVSGFNNGANGDQDPMFMNLSMNHHDLINWVLNDPYHKLTRDPNMQWEYVNFGYCVLGRVIEKVSGQTYEQYVKQNVLTPSGATDMVIGANSEAQRKPREVKYYPPGSPYSLNVTRFDSHGGWLASPIDLERFLVRVDGFPTKPDLINATLHTQMVTPAHIKDKSGNDPNYAFGWGANPQSHNGAMDGTIAYLAVLNGGYTFAVVANSRPASDIWAGNLYNTVQSIVNGVSAWPNYDLF